jgi:hypothetical protein
MLNSYPLLCQRCGEIASLKIASEWSDGQTRELKTYSICCGGCLSRELASAQSRQKSCRLSAGEVLGLPGIYDEQRPRNRGRAWVLRG